MWHIWKVTYLRRNVTIVCGMSYHLLGSQISWYSKIQFWLQVKSYISDWQFSKSGHLARYVSCHNAMAYDTPYCSGLPINAIPESDKDEESPTFHEHKQKYQSVISSIGWLAQSTHPDLAPLHSYLSAYFNTPSCSHWNAALYVIHFIHLTVDYGISFTSTEKTPLHTYMHFPHSLDTEAYGDVIPPKPSPHHLLTTYSDVCWGLNLVTGSRRVSNYLYLNSELWVELSYSDLAAHVLGKLSNRSEHHSVHATPKYAPQMLDVAWQWIFKTWFLTYHFSVIPLQMLTHHHQYITIAKHVWIGATIWPQKENGTWNTTKTRWKNRSKMAVFPSHILVERPIHQIYSPKKCKTAPTLGIYAIPSWAVVATFSAESTTTCTQTLSQWRYPIYLYHRCWLHNGLNTFRLQHQVSSTLLSCTHTSNCHQLYPAFPVLGKISYLVLYHLLCTGHYEQSYGG